MADDRFLSMATRCVFQAGFNWRVIENKWDGFEAAFDGFNPNRWALMSGEDFDALVTDERIVRNPQKIKAVPVNAAMFRDMANAGGSVAAFFSNWPGEDYIGLLAYLKENGARLGGNSAQYFLRRMGVDSFVLSRDVIARLVAEGVVDKAPTSKKALAAVQEAFNAWAEEGGKSLTVLSRTLAFSVG